MRILLLPPSYTSPAARFRVLQFAAPLRDLGHDVTVRVIRPERFWQSSLRHSMSRQIHRRAATAVRLASAWLALRDVEAFDIVFVNRDLLPELRIHCLEPWLARRNPRIVFDFDDAIFLGPRDAKLRKILPHFAAVTAGNQTLARYARRWNSNVTVLPTVVDTAYYSPVPRRPGGPIRIGWTGSEGTMRRHLPIVGPALSKLAEDNDFEFVVICDRPPPFAWPGVNLRFVRWDPRTEAEDLRRIDIGLMPLTDGPFEAGKCGTKAILHMAAGVPVVVSPVGVNKNIVVHGRTGFHCLTGDEWFGALKTLLRDQTLRRRMGAAGRSRSVRLYSRQRILPELLALFEQVASRSTSPAAPPTPETFSPRLS